MDMCVVFGIRCVGVLKWLLLRPLSQWIEPPCSFYISIEIAVVVVAQSVVVVAVAALTQLT